MLVRLFTMGLLLFVMASCRLGGGSDRVESSRPSETAQGELPPWYMHSLDAIWYPNYHASDEVRISAKIGEVQGASTLSLFQVKFTSQQDINAIAEFSNGTKVSHSISIEYLKEISVSSEGSFSESLPFNADAPYILSQSRFAHSTQLNLEEFDPQTAPFKVIFMKMESKVPSDVAMYSESWRVGLSDLTTWPISLAGDFNKDGKTDIASWEPRWESWWVSIPAQTQFLNIHWGYWSSGPDWKNALSGDFNGDGISDVAARTGTEWWVSLSDGKKFTPSFWGHWPTELNWRCVDAGDFNGDGRTDIVGYRSDGNLILLQSDGDSFSPRNWGTLPSGADYNHCRFGDFNNDNRKDIALYSSSGSGWSIGLSQESNSFSFGTNLVGSDVLESEAETAIVGDFNGDGVSDLAYLAQNHIWQMNLSGDPSTGFDMSCAWPTISVESDNIDISAIDIDGDGKEEVLARDLLTGTWRKAALFEGSLVCADAGQWSEKVDWTDLHVGDFLPEVPGKEIAARVIGGTWWVSHFRQ